MDHPKDPVEIAVAVVELDGRFLVGRRAAGADLAGLAEFPGGKVRPNESPAAAAARECLEETGLTVAIGPAYSVVEHEYPYGLLRLHFFAARPLDPQAQPRSPFRWVEQAALAEMTFPPANAALLERLLAGEPT